MGTTRGVIKEYLSSSSTIVNTHIILRYFYSSFGGGNNFLKLQPCLKYLSKDRKLLINGKVYVGKDITQTYHDILTLKRR